ncbi:MAG: SpoIIE family protein phosphatase, partial [Acidobacteriota bacterium]
KIEPQSTQRSPRRLIELLKVLCALRGDAWFMGDSLLLFTDGVTEMINADGAEFGNHRLCESILGFDSGSSSDLISRCLGHVANFRGNAERRDDLSMLALAFV